MDDELVRLKRVQFKTVSVAQGKNARLFVVGEPARVAVNKCFRLPAASRRVSDNFIDAKALAERVERIFN